MSYTAVLFDLDGTLLDTLADISEAVNKALLSLNLPTHPKDAYKIFVGEGIRVLAQRVLPKDKQSPDDVKACLTAITREYGTGLLHKTAPYPHIAALLDALTTKHIKIAVVSNKPHDLSERSVKACLPHIPFNVVLGQRAGVPTKPNPSIALEAASLLQVSPSQCLYVGDSGIDMETATRAGMFPVGVLWGFRGEKELMDHGAKKLIKDPRELLEMV
jgi:phosphoglycolate phosphatase